MNTDLSRPPEPLVPKDQWADFCEWATDCGYDQSYFNRFDSKSLVLQQLYLEEMAECESFDVIHKHAKQLGDRP